MTMTELLNNAYFWQKIDTLYVSLDYKHVRAIGDAHQQYSNLIYPCEYGYLIDTDNDSEVIVKVFRGTKTPRRTDSIIVCADILTKGMDIKLLVGCTDEEKMSILEFLNSTSFQKTILVHRGDDVPSWAEND